MTNDERGSAFVLRSRDYGATREALRGALGEKYVAYMRRTKRLVPGIY